MIDTFLASVLLLILPSFRIMVRLGELDVRTDRDCNTDGSACIEAQDFEIDRITAHSMYDTPKYANDIALIRLKRTTNSSKTTL